MPSIEGRVTDIVNRSHHAAAYDYAFGLLGDGDSGDVLDVGTGDGSALLMGMGWAGRKLDSGLIVASDANTKIMADIRRRKEVTPLTAKNNLPFEDNTFDLVISSQVIEHIPRDQHQDFTREMIRVIKPGSHVVISTIDRDFPHPVKGHKNHIAEYDRTQAQLFASSMERYGKVELITLIASDRYLRGQVQRAKYWWLRPVKDIIPRVVFDKALRILTKGEIHSNLDMRDDFWVKPLHNVSRDETISDFVFVVEKSQKS